MRFTTKVGAGLMCCAAGSVAGLMRARESYPDDRPAPGIWDVIGWLFSFQDGWAVAAVVIAVASAVWAAWEWFQPGPPTIEEIGATVGTAIAPVRDNVDELSGQIWQEGQVADHRHEQVLAAITQDKISVTLKELERPDADPALLAEFERVIRIAKERNLPITEEQAAGIAETAARMGRSNRPGDDEIARLIEQGDYRGAARRKAELARAGRRNQEAGSRRTARRSDPRPALCPLGSARLS